MKLFTAAIGAKHKITGDFVLKAGTIEAETAAAAEEAALGACHRKFPTSLYSEHYVNVQDIHERIAGWLRYIENSATFVMREGNPQPNLPEPKRIPTLVRNRYARRKH